MGKIKLEDLKDFCKKALEKEGMSPGHAEITAQVLSETDGYGTHSHGTKNLHNYIKKARAGGIDIKAQPIVVKEGAAFAVMDAKKAMGMVPSVLAMRLACKKAKESGVGLVTVKNSCHFGAAGYYANLAASQGMVGFAVSNVDPNMNAPGAKGKAVGNNPLAYASPSKTVPSVFLDIAMSNVASLKVFQAKADGKSIPNTWIVDKDGLPTEDPSHYPQEGAMQPMAAHKGYGLAILVDLLSGVLNGGATSMDGQITSWVLEMEKPNLVSHTFIAIDASKFLDDESLENRTETMATQLRALPKAKDVQRIYTPGEIEWERYKKASENGVELPKELESSLRELAEDVGIAINIK